MLWYHVRINSRLSPSYTAFHRSEGRAWERSYPWSRWSQVIVYFGVNGFLPKVNYPPLCDQCYICSSWLLYQLRSQLAKRKCSEIHLCANCVTDVVPFMPWVFLQPDSFNEWTVWEQNLLEPLALKLHSHHIKLIHMNGECVYLGLSEHLYQSFNSSLTLVEWRTMHLLQVGISYSRVSDPWENSYCGVHCPADQLLWNKWTGGPHTQGPIYFMTGMWPKLEVYCKLNCLISWPLTTAN